MGTELCEFYSDEATKIFSNNKGSFRSFNMIYCIIDYCIIQ